MSTTWERIKSLEGQTLDTISRREPFKVISVENNAVIVQPQSTGKDRRIRRPRFETAMRMRANGVELRPSTLNIDGAMGLSASYIAAILHELEAADTT